MKDVMSEFDLKAFLVAIESVRAEHASSPEKARRFLQDEGVLTQSGQLAERYAAPKQPSAEPNPRAQIN